MLIPGPGKVLTEFVEVTTTTPSGLITIPDSAQQQELVIAKVISENRFNTDESVFTEGSKVLFRRGDAAEIALQDRKFFVMSEAAILAVITPEDDE